MAKNKTTETGKSVTEFVNNVENEVKRSDSLKLIEIFKSITGHEPKMWGPSIIGFGKYHYNTPVATKEMRRWSAFRHAKILWLFISLQNLKCAKNCFRNLVSTRVQNVVCMQKKLEDIDIAVLKTIIKNSMARVVLAENKSEHDSIVN